MDPNGQMSYAQKREEEWKKSFPDIPPDEMPKDITLEDLELFNASSEVVNKKIKEFNEGHQILKSMLPTKTNDKSGPRQSKRPSGIVIGEHIMEPRYESPYPREYIRLDFLYLCQFCFGYKKSEQKLVDHINICPVRSPPGKNIYTKGNLSVFEVDGKEQKGYCQKLCLVAKFFLDSKHQYYDVEPFLFYILTQKTEPNCHVMVGYFSKEKWFKENFNVSSILTLPQYQRKGFGRFLIDFSYLLSKKEDMIGTPERPLSNSGKATYLAYWKSCILQYIHSLGQEKLALIEVKNIITHTGISCDDILTTLEEIKFIEPTSNVMNITWDVVESCVKQNRKNIVLDENVLNWEPTVYEPFNRRKGAKEQSIGVTAHGTTTLFTSVHETKLLEMPRAKNDSKPRGRMTAYAFFVQTCREEHKKKHPDESVVFSEFSRKCAERWKTTSEKEKKRFQEMADRDKKRYELEMQGYVPAKEEKGSGKKRRHTNDPNAPKGSLTEFFWFCNDERPKVKGMNPEYGVGEIAKELGRLWAKADPEVKRKYEAMAERDKARYEREMTAYKKRGKPEAPAPAHYNDDDGDDDDDDEEGVEDE